ncbi:MAG: hypothetical protein ACK5AZ_16420 [Bryobacteraceae bacterium]
MTRTKKNGVLPNANLALTGFYSITVAYALASLFNLAQAPPSLSFTYRCVLGGILVSTSMAYASHALPNAIRSRTSVLAFLIWTFLAVAFSAAAAFYSNQVPFAMSIFAALASLLLVAYQFHLGPLLSFVPAHDVSSGDSDPNAEHLFRGILAFIFAIMCSVATFVVPILALVNSDYRPVALIITVLHVLSFGSWMLLALNCAVEF